MHRVRTTSWRDHLTLLGGGQHAGNIAAHLLSESISDVEMPLVMHELCTSCTVKSTTSASKKCISCCGVNMFKI